jgi:glycosyltransferase involved in cell wall biosynthesis
VVLIVKISVIIPTYNYGEFICDSIESVINQTYKDFEIIVVDDGSTDNTPEVVKKYKDRVSYIYKENEGPSSARNYGIKNAKGEYLCFLDSDDIFLPEKLELQAKYMEDHRDDNIGLIYSDYYCVSRKLKIIDYYESIGFSSQIEAIKYLFNYNYINTSTVMIPKTCIDRIGIFNEKYRYLEDYDLWLRLGCNYKFLYINEPLVKTRSHYKNHRNKVGDVEMINNAKKIKEDIRSQLSLMVKEDS